MDMKSVEYCDENERVDGLIFLSSKKLTNKGLIRWLGGNYS